MVEQILRKIRSSFGLKIWICSVFVCLSDYFFYEEPVGWLSGLFSMIFLFVLFAVHKRSSINRLDMACLGVGLFEALTLVYSPNALSVLVYFFCVSTLSMQRSKDIYEHALTWFRGILVFLLSIPLKSIMDFRLFQKAERRIKSSRKISGVLQRWALPVIFTGVFVFLFSVANPLIDAQLKVWSFARIFEGLSIQRALFWGIAFAVLWAFLRPALVKCRPVRLASPEFEEKSQISWLFNPGAILRSLLMFNVLFMLQTSMDVVYLWGGVRLPDGMTFARYARQGAYPLIVTALLAAAFVLIALRNKNLEKAYSWIKWLIYVWVAQNIFLVFSSILRTNLYIEEYSLTVLRFSALIWMGIVASGLFLIVMRISLQKNNAWLVNANMAVLGIVLIVCSILDIGAIVANYNVAHCREITGQGSGLDTAYLEELGTSSLPALSRINNNQSVSFDMSRAMLEDNLRNRIRKNTHDWRAWTIREYLLCNNTNSGNICETSGF